jgi:hypothetical protein
VGFIVAGDSYVNIDSRIRSSLAYLREVLDSRAFVGGACFTHLTHLLLHRVMSFSFGQKNYEPEF